MAIRDMGFAIIITVQLITQCPKLVQCIEY